MLQKYVNDGIELIAITDHNTLNGYKKILEIKHSLIKYIEDLETLSHKSGIPSKDVHEYKEKYSLFEKISILPGVELEVNPGVHILVIFNPDITLDQMEFVISKIGYEEDNFGSENISYIETDILNLFSILEGMDCLVIASHVDSDKGIYNSLKGKYRAQIFQNKRLNGVQYLNQKCADQIKSLIMNKEYKRSTPLAFIKASDFHGDLTKKSDVIYADLDNLAYEDLFEAFKMPEQKFSLSKNPEIESIIRNVLSLESTLIYDFPKDYIPDSIDQRLSNYLCALLNSGYSNLVFGVTGDSFRNLVGILFDFKDIQSQISLHLKQISINNSGIHISIAQYVWSNKYIYIVNVNSSKNKIYSTVENKSFLIEKNDIVDLSISEIVRITEDKIVKNMKDYLKKNRTRIRKLSNELSLLHELNNCFDSFIEIESTTLPLIDIVEVEELDHKSDDLKSKSVLGNRDFNIAVPYDELPRNKEAYMRFLPYTVLEENYVSETFFNGESILITPKGASYYVESNKYAVLCNNTRSVLKLTIKETFKEKVSLKLIIAWLKSSLFIFYMYATQESLSIYEPSVIKNAPGIINITKFEGDKVVELVNTIIELELEFIQKTNEYCNAECNNCILSIEEQKEIHERLAIEMSEFNEQILEYVNEIDYIFYESFKLSDEVISTINYFFELHNMCRFQEQFQEI